MVENLQFIPRKLKFYFMFFFSWEFLNVSYFEDSWAQLFTIFKYILASSRIFFTRNLKFLWLIHCFRFSLNFTNIWDGKRINPLIRKWAILGPFSHVEKSWNQRKLNNYPFSQNLICQIFLYMKGKILLNLEILKSKNTQKLGLSLLMRHF